jgi:arsenate reductase
MGFAGSTNELRLLADPTRARILSLIMHSPDGRRLVGHLAAELNLRQPTVSHHVAALFDEGLLERRPDGRNVWYSIAPDRADRVADVLDDAPATGMVDGVLDRITADLAARFAGTLAPDTVARYVRGSHALLADQARTTRHLTSLTSTFAADRLSALAEGERRGHERVPGVLFVCVQNAGRSQMAAGILRHLAGDRVGVRSAGSAPASAVRSMIVTALDEIGVPIGGEYPKPLTDEVVRAADVVVTMGCGDACPVYPGRRYLAWDLDDPVGLPLARVREIRDDIEARVRQLLPSLEPTGTP